VTCAVAIQAGMAERNAHVPEEQQINFRIGVHLGDVIVEGDDLYGDGVNIAARLEGLAVAGGICISRQALDQVENKLGLSYESLGEREVKNIARPVTAYRVVIDGEACRVQAAMKRRAPYTSQMAGSVTVVLLIVAGVIAFWWQPWIFDKRQPSIVETALPIPEGPSIAVLPFINISDDPSQEYFADGMAEDLMTDLSRFSGLLVVARTSSFIYKRKTVDVRQVGRELGVRYVLEGSVRQVGGRVRINVQLVDTTSGGHLWAQRFDRELSDIFAVQDEITERVVGAIGAIGGGRGALQQAELERVTGKPTESLQAYDFFLRGIFHIDRLTKEDNLRAREMFQKAIEYDPNYARAYGQLAWTYLIDVYMDFGDSPDESLREAHRLAEKAVAVDASDPKAHWALATVYHFQQKDDRAIAKYQEALALNPNDADVLAEYGSILAMAGRSGEGLEQIRKAMLLNPYYPEWYAWDLGLAHFMAKEYEEVIVVLDPLTIDALQIHTLLAASYAHLDRYEEAQNEIAEILRIKPDISLSAPGLGYRSMTDRQAYIDGLRKAGLPE